MPQRTIVVCIRQMPIRHLPITRILSGAGPVPAHAQNGAKSLGTVPYATVSCETTPGCTIAGGKVNAACSDMCDTRNRRRGIRLQGP
jgi:hypothetical protein